MKFPDYKHIITEKTFDTAYYAEGKPYHIYLPDNLQYNKQYKHLKGKDFYAICTESGGYYLGFVVIQPTGVRANYKDTYIHFTIEQIDNSNIKIIACYDEEEVRDVVKSVKSNPETYNDIEEYGTLKDLQKIEKEQAEKETAYEATEKVRNAVEMSKQECLKKVQNYENPFKSAPKAPIDKQETKPDTENTTEVSEDLDNDDYYDDEGWHTVYIYEDDD